MLELKPNLACVATVGVLVAGLVVPAYGAPVDSKPAPRRSVDHTNTPIYRGDAVKAARLDRSSAAARQGASRTATLYENMAPGPGGYISLGTSPVGGSLGFDDYVSTDTAPFALGQMGFVGGVTNPGEVLFFNFYDAVGVPSSSFGVQFPSAGNYFHTLTLAPPITVPERGFLEVVADDGSVTVPSSGEWLLGDAGPTVGTEDPFFGGAGDGQFSHNFSLEGTTCQGDLSVDCNNNGIADECEPGACCAIGVDGVAACLMVTEADCQAVTPPGLWRGPCKQCPEQNADIAYHDGVLIVHTTGNPVDCPPAKSARGGRACIPVDPKIDPWISVEADPQNPVICHDFGAAGSCGPLPADFFEPGSDPFSDAVCLSGVPLGSTPWGDFGDADTLIERSGGGSPSNGDPFDSCALPSGAGVTETVDIEIVALNLVGSITVTLNGGQDPEDWDVAVDLSANPQQAGTLTANKTHCNGGSYTAQLPVLPRFTFTKVSDPGQIRVLDAGVAGCDPVDFDLPALDNNPGSWVHEVDPDLGVVIDECSTFHPAINDPTAPAACDCNTNGVRDACDTPDGDIDGNGQTDLADLAIMVDCITGLCNDTPCFEPLYGDPCCVLADFDRDGDIDLEDYREFQQAFDGP
ncbi:MAG: hypothetical protein GY842_24295 [bacterium]|nr:hypothetical protein [bacterium]